MKITDNSIEYEYLSAITSSDNKTSFTLVIVKFEANFGDIVGAVDVEKIPLQHFVIADERFFTLVSMKPTTTIIEDGNYNDIWLLSDYELKYLLRIMKIDFLSKLLLTK